MAEQELPEVMAGRDLVDAQVGFLRANITHANKKIPVYMGRLPRGAVILTCQAFTKSVLNDAKVQVGKTAGGKDICELEVKAVGVKSHTFSENKMFVDADKEWSIYATLDKEVNSGECVVVLTFVTNR